MRLSVGLVFAVASGLLLVTAAPNEEINFPVQLIEPNHGFVETMPLTRQVIPHKKTNPRFFRKKLKKLLKKKLLLLKFKKLLPLKLLFLRSNDGIIVDSRKPVPQLSSYLESTSQPNFQLYNDGGNLPSYEVPGELLRDDVLDDDNDDNDSDDIYENYESSDRPKYGFVNKGITTTTTEVGPPPPPLFIFAMPPPMEFGRAYAYLGSKDRKKFKQ